MIHQRTLIHVRVSFTIGTVGLQFDWFGFSSFSTRHRWLIIVWPSDHQILLVLFHFKQASTFLLVLFQSRQEWPDLTRFLQDLPVLTIWPVGFKYQTVLMATDQDFMNQDEIKWDENGQNMFVPVQHTQKQEYFYLVKYIPVKLETICTVIHFPLHVSVFSGYIFKKIHHAFENTFSLFCCDILLSIFNSENNGGLNKKAKSFIQCESCHSLICPLFTQVHLSKMLHFCKTF